MVMAACFFLYALWFGLKRNLRHFRESLLRHSREGLLRHSREGLLRHSREGLLRHSREGGNPPHHPSFPRRRESTIPAHAGINRPITPMPEKTLRHSHEGGNPHPIIRHSREGGNPQFPHTREFLVPLTQCPKKHSIIPAFAGMMDGMDSCLRGNSGN